MPAQVEPTAIHDKHVNASNAQMHRLLQRVWQVVNVEPNEAYEHQQHQANHGAVEEQSVKNLF